MTLQKGEAARTATGTADAHLSPIKQATIRLFWSWMLVLFVALLGLFSITVVLVQRHTEQAIEPELRVTTQEVARGLQNELDRALALGIPFEQLGGVAVWLEESLKTQPVLKGIALIGTQGQVLYHAGESQEIWQAWASEQAHPFENKSATVETVDRGPLGEVATAVTLYAPVSTTTLGYLVVTGYIPPVPQFFWFISGGALVLTWVLAGVWLRYRLWRDVSVPLYDLDKGFSALAEQRLLVLPFRQTRPVILHQIHHHWVGQLHRTQAHWQALLDKIAEVKASHFDLLVLQRLDQLAATASTWTSSSDLNSNNAFNEEQLSIKRTSTFSLWRLWEQRSLPVQIFTGVLVALLCLMVLAWGWQTQLQTQQTRQMLQHQESLVQLSWQNAISSQRTRLESMIDTWHHEQINRAVWIQELAGDDDDSHADVAHTRINKMQVLLQMADAHLSVLDGRGTLIATSAHKPIRPYPSSALLMTQWPSNMSEARTGPSLSRVFGIWQGQDRSFQLGWIQRLEDEQGVWVLTLSHSLNTALDELAKKLNAPVALADLRGQVIGSDTHGLVSSWRAHQRQSHATFLPHKQETAFHVLAVPLISLSGHTSATLLVAFEAAPVTWFPSAMSYALAGLICVICGLLCWGLLAMLRFVSKIGQRMQHLAQAKPQEKSFDIEEDGSLSSLHLPSLLQATENLRQRINDFTVLRRSRERQGRRQARFIRHQMMALAQRLNEDARQGILDDLARIESASKSHHVAHAGLGIGRGRDHAPVETVADEISVLALGFQNLVHRVGDQYQQLAQLVQELREALRVKTQYIAIQQELEIARKMQLAILPQAFAQTNGFSIDARMLPAKEIGGDFYDFFPLDAHRVAIAVADVSGKGIPAAFFMAVSRTLLRAVAPFDPSPAVCLSRLNNLLSADNPEMMFVTLFYAVLDTRTGHVQYGSAGHNPPYLIRHRSDVPIEIPSLGNMALAVMEDMPYDQADFVLEPGDRLFLYTDGVTEAMSPEQELYGEERLMLLLTQLQQTPAALLPDLVLDVLHAFEGDGAQADDITTLVVHHTQANPT